MPSFLAFIAAVALVLSLATSFASLWFGVVDFDNAMELLTALLSWKVIAGGLVLGAGTMFGEAIKARLAA